MIAIAFAALLQLASSPVEAALPTPCLQGVAAEAEGLDGLARSLYGLCRDQLGAESSIWAGLAANAALVDARLGIATALDGPASTEPNPSEAQAYAVALAMAYRGDFAQAHDAAAAIAADAVDANVRTMAVTLKTELSLAMGRCDGGSSVSTGSTPRVLAAHAFALWCAGDLEAAAKAFDTAQAANPADRILAAARDSLSRAKPGHTASESPAPVCARAFQDADPSRALPSERVADIYRCLFRAP
ncbi:hypothetical protein [Brevundimonas aurifodinae]|uniref:Tetratricopeptide repeat protein n=1 Tax=Brevundimonas aurifodinae TaxID=1508312 RepID=A0ABV1NL18_9CAUL